MLSFSKEGTCCLYMLANFSKTTRCIPLLEEACGLSAFKCKLPVFSHYKHLPEDAVLLSELTGTLSCSTNVKSISVLLQRLVMIRPCKGTTGPTSFG